MKVEELARLCHEANRVYCQTIGDNSQLHWEEAAGWQREAMINGVMFHMNNPDAGPSGSHENWMKLKLSTGWVFGPTKDAALKQHPCLVPYDQLPEEQRIKDHLFVSIFNVFKDRLESSDVSD